MAAEAPGRPPLRTVAVGTGTGSGTAAGSQSFAATQTAWPTSPARTLATQTIRDSTQSAEQTDPCVNPNFVKRGNLEEPLGKNAEDNGQPAATNALLPSTNTSGNRLSGHTAEWAGVSKSEGDRIGFGSGADVYSSYTLELADAASDALAAREAERADVAADAIEVG